MLLIVVWQDSLIRHLGVAIEFKVLGTVIALFVTTKTSRHLDEVRCLLSGEQLLHNLESVRVFIFAG